MAKFKHLTKEKMDKVTNDLWEIKSSLKGLGCLFQYKDDGGHAFFDTSDLFGIGQLIKGIAKRVSVLEDILRCGYDSMAITEDKEFTISEEIIEKAREILNPSPKEEKGEMKNNEKDEEGKP